MKNGLLLMLWACAALAFGDEDPALQARIDAARARLDSAARELAELHRQDTFEIELPNPRARVSLGVLLTPGGTDGVAIAGVTPGGPAAESGIEAGDVLIAINGTNLRDAGAVPPAALVFDVLKDVAPGDTVRVEYLRGAETLSADLTARDPVPAPTAGIAMTRMAFVAGPGAPPSFSGRAMIGGLELFDLNETLGHYFGVSEGVLVLSAGSDKDGGGLLAGDVVKSIDGHPIASSAECVEAFAGKHGPVTVEVQRDGVALSVPFVATGDGANAMLPSLDQAHGMRVIRLDAQPKSEQRDVIYAHP